MKFTSSESCTMLCIWWPFRWRLSTSSLMKLGIMMSEAWFTSRARSSFNLNFKFYSPAWSLPSWFPRSCCGRGSKWRGWRCEPATKTQPRCRLLSLFSQRSGALWISEEGRVRSEWAVILKRALRWQERDCVSPSSSSWWRRTHRRRRALTRCRDRGSLGFPWYLRPMKC